MITVLILFSFMLGASFGMIVTAIATASAKASRAEEEMENKNNG